MAGSATEKQTGMTQRSCGRVVALRNIGSRDNVWRTTCVILPNYGKMRRALFLAVVSLSGCGTITVSTSVSRSPSTAAVSGHPSAWQTVLTTKAEVTGVAVDGQGN